MLIDVVQRRSGTFCLPSSASTNRLPYTRYTGKSAGAKSGEQGGWLISTTPQEASKCFTLTAEWLTSSAVPKYRGLKSTALCQCYTDVTVSAIPTLLSVLYRRHCPLSLLQARNFWAWRLLYEQQLSILFPFSTFPSEKIGSPYRFALVWHIVAESQWNTADTSTVYSLQSTIFPQLVSRVSGNLMFVRCCMTTNKNAIHSPVVAISTAQWLLYVPHSGYYMCRQFNIQQF